MTKEELLKTIRDTAGEEIAAAFKRIEEKRKEAGVADAPQAAQIIEVGTVEDRKNLAATKKGLVFSGVVAALAKAKGNATRAVEIAEKEWKQPDVAKALTAGVAEEGGFTIGVQHSEEIIDLLTPRTHVRRHVSGGTVSLEAGVATVSRLTGGASISWGGEVTKIRRSQQAFGLITLRSKFPKVIVPISNTLLRRGGPRIQNMIRFDTLRSMALGEDEQFLFGEGTEHRPKGLFEYCLPSHKFAANGTLSLDNVTADLGKLVLALEEANVGMTNPFWSLAPRTKQALATVRIPNGPFAFRDELLQGRLWGWPVESTTQVPTNLGDDEDESVIMLTDGDEIALGQGMSLQVALSEEAVIVDDDGTIHSAFQQDMTFMRVINEVDLKPRHDEAIAALTGVTWAPGNISNS
jgi:HK97 family phage major capsid protein